MRGRTAISSESGGGICGVVVGVRESEGQASQEGELHNASLPPGSGDGDPDACGEETGAGVGGEMGVQRWLGRYEAGINTGEFLEPISRRQHGPQADGALGHGQDDDHPEPDPTGTLSLVVSGRSAIEVDPGVDPGGGQRPTGDGLDLRRACRSGAGFHPRRHLFHSPRRTHP